MAPGDRPTPCAALPDVACGEEKLDCYTGLYESRAWVLKPDSVEQLRRVLVYARDTGRRVTLRAGANSFDGQALGDDLVISMERLNAIEVLDGEKVRVGPGARWGEIFAALEPLGLVPAVTVTTENATAGGTLSGGCLSRFSPAYGKEGKWVESFDLLTVDGELLSCAPPRADTPRETWTREERAFSGAIGGLGWLGAVVAITYRVLSVGSTDGEIGVRTLVRKYESFGGLARDLVPATEEMYCEDSDPCNEEKLDAIWSALVTRRDGRERALFFTSRFTTTTERRRMPQHRPKLLSRVLFEWLMRVPALARLLWRIVFRWAFRRGEYIDDLEGFTFFMDGNARAKRIAKRLGFPMRNVQQTFVVPFDPDAPRGWEDAENTLVQWLGAAHKLFAGADLRPTLHDVLFLPGDDPFLLSATADRSGFAVSYAFETSNLETIGRVKEAFAELADLLWERFGGRVYLVKNVFASRATLAEMYRGNAERFFALKRELDPGGLLRNDFLERTFGELLE